MSSCPISKRHFMGQNKSKYYSRLSSFYRLAVISSVQVQFGPSPVQNRIWGYYFYFFGQSFSPKRISKLIKSREEPSGKEQIGRRPNVSNSQFCGGVFYFTVLRLKTIYLYGHVEKTKPNLMWIIKQFFFSFF